MIGMQPGTGVASGSVRYRVEDLGVLSDTNISVATALNNRGQVTGFCYQHVPPGHFAETLGRPFLWEKGKLQALPRLEGKLGHASQINSQGDVVGDADTSRAWFPALWKAGASKPTQLTEEAGRAVAINDRGDLLINTTAVARGDKEWTTTDAWWLRTRAGRRLIPSPDARRIRLTGLNQQNKVIGYSYGDGAGDANTLGGSGVPQDQKAFVWHDGSSRWLPVPKGAKGVPRDLNERGVIVGWSGVNEYEPHACRWGGDQMTDLGTLGGKSSEALSINKHGVVVGFAEDFAGDRQACIWINGKPRSLKALIPTRPELHLRTAADVNDRGQILTRGADRHGNHKSWLLTPTE